MTCTLNRIYLADVVFQEMELFALLSAHFIPDTGPWCLDGFSEVCFPEPGSDVAAAAACSMVTEQMQAILNTSGVVTAVAQACEAGCWDAFGMPSAYDANLFDRMDVMGTGVAQTCWSLHALDDLDLECQARLAAWVGLAENVGLCDWDTAAVVAFISPAPSCTVPEPYNWDCVGTPTFMDLYPTAAMDCVVVNEGFAVACASPSRDTDRTFSIDTANSFVNVFQPEETAPSGATCARSLLGTTSLSGDIWLDGGFCPGNTCPVAIGDFEWTTTSPLDLGAICGGMDLGDVPLARFTAVDTIDLTAGPDGPATNEVLIAPGAFVSSLSFASGGDVLGLQIQNALAETVLLDAAANRVILDLTFMQDLVVTSREFEVHLEAALTNTRPVADAGPDRTAACGETVTLSSASTDADGAGDIVSFLWTAVDPATGARTFQGRGSSITVIPFETTEFVLSVVDASGATDEDSVVVTLPPFDPVAIDSVTVAPECLWPPNHSYVPYRLGTDLVVTTSGGVCGTRGPFVRITGVTSDEPDDGRGDGNTTDDAVFIPGALCVRSERSGGGDGRVYAVTVEARDAAGNVAVATVPITVPHDQHGARGCDAEPTFVGDDDPRCAFGRRSSAAATAGCACSVVGEGTGGNVAGTAALSLLAVLFAWVRRRRR